LFPTKNVVISRAMNDEATRSRKQAGVIGAAVGVAAVGAIVFVVMNEKAGDEEERVSQPISARDTQFPKVEPKPVQLVRDEGRAVVDTKPDPYVERQKALAGGILGSTALAQGGAFASLTGTGNVKSGFDDNIYGGLLGNEAGEMKGGFGYGRSGFGPGGGGTGWGTIGTGRYGSIGHGGGTGTGYGVGGGRGGLAGRSGTAPRPTVTFGVFDVVGDLDKAIVRRYVRRNIQKLIYCYEKELLAKATLEGTVTTRWMIDANGHVTGATASGVDGTVSSCMASVLGGIEFPKPTSGDVKVSLELTVRPK
jgi:hypothetical protein